MKRELWLRNRIERRRGQLAQTTESLSVVIQNLILAELEEVLRD